MEQGEVRRGLGCSTPESASAVLCKEELASHNSALTSPAYIPDVQLLHSLSNDGQSIT